MWVAIEVLSGAYPMSGFTWGRLVFATIDTPYAGWLPWVGANGVSLLVALTASVLAWLALRLRGRWAQRERRDALVAGGVLVATAAAVVLPGLVTWSGEDAGTARIAIVQGDVPGNGDDLLAYNREVTRSHVDLTRDLAADVDAGRAQRPDFVVWPENSTATDPFRDEEIRSALRSTAAALRAPILVGGVVDAPEDGEVLNQGIVYDPVQGAGDRYTKRHPVPFGEYIPYREKLGIDRNFSQLSQVPRDMLSGTRTCAAADRRHAGGRRDLLRRVLRRRDQRAGARGSGAAHRADLQRVLHPHRPDRAAVRDEPAPCPRDRADGRDRLGQRPQRVHRTGRHRPGRDRAPHPGRAGPGRPAGPGGPAVHGGSARGWAGPPSLVALVAVLWALLPYRRRRKSAPEAPAREKVAAGRATGPRTGESV